MHSAEQPSMTVLDGRRLDGDLTKRLVEFLGHAFVAWPGQQSQLDPHEHFLWKVGAFPCGSTVLVAESGPRVLGLYVVLHRRWLVKGVPRSVRDVVDLSVDPEHRGQGVYRLMSRYAHKHVNVRFDMSFVYLDKPQTRRVARQAGERSPSNRVAVLVWVRSTRRLAARLRKVGSRVPAPLLSVGIRAIKMTNRLRYRGASLAAAECDIRTVDRFDKRIQPFAQKATSAFDLVQERNARYLNWRYADRRGGSFTIRLAEQDGQILGYAVVSASGDRAYIADLMALPGRTDVAWSLIGDAITILEADGISHVVCWLPRFHPYYRLLRNAGFVDSFRDAGAAYRPLGLAAHELSFLEDKKARIHVMIGDSDHV